MVNYGIGGQWKSVVCSHTHTQIHHHPFTLSILYPNLWYRTTKRLRLGNCRLTNVNLGWLGRCRWCLKQARKCCTWSLQPVSAAEQFFSVRWAMHALVTFGDSRSAFSAPSSCFMARKATEIFKKILQNSNSAHKCFTQTFFLSRAVINHG
jgi:hypothetical protein